MLTEECHLNEYLAENGVEVIDSDLGEYIVQLRKSRQAILFCRQFTLKKKM